MQKTLSQHWFWVQEKLFPFVEKEWGVRTEKHQQLVTLIELVDVRRVLPCYVGEVGRPQDDRRALLYAFFAKSVYNFPTTVILIDRLHCDPVLRRICGWERKAEIPSESTFSRAFKEFADANVPAVLHEAFIKEQHGDRMIFHVSRDATAIEAREKAVAKPEVAPTPKPKRGRPKKGEEKAPKEPKRLEKQVGMSLTEMLADLPKECDIGCKKNSKGYSQSWRGYKLHIDTIDGDIPVSAVLTSASVHDSQVALPLGHITKERITHLYSLMDAAYDAQAIRDHEKASGHMALIDFNRRTPEDQRFFMPCERDRYKQRSAAERVNSQLKDNLGGRFVRVRGHAKIFAHLMFGVLTLAVFQTLRPVT